MSRKLLITLATVGAIVVAGVASAGIVAYSSCGYDEKTGNYLFEGKEYAHGTMDSAMECGGVRKLKKMPSILFLWMN